MQESNAQNVFVSDRAKVIEAEGPYLEERRKKYKDLPAFDPRAAWGLCLSGGGVRSATFALGVLQSLVRLRVGHWFDYLATVSGGGYMGACLTSLLSRRGETSMDPKYSPFVGLEEKDSAKYEKTAGTTLSVRAQMHHLRTHGSYLAVHERGLLSLPIERAVGSIAAGVAHHILLFLLLLALIASGFHLFVQSLDLELTFLQAQKYTRDDLPWREMLSAWWHKDVLRFYRVMINGRGGLAEYWPTLTWAVFAGAIWSTAWILVARARGRRPQSLGEAPEIGTPSGWTTADRKDATFLSCFNFGSIALALAAGAIYGCCIPHPALVGMFVPFAIGLGGWTAALLLINVGHSWWPNGIRERSLSSAIQGAGVYGLLAGAALPIAIAIVHSLPRLDWWTLGIAAAGLPVGTFFWKPAVERVQAGSRSWTAALLGPILTFAVAAAFLVIIAGVAEGLIGFYGPSPGLWPFLVLAFSLGGLLVFGVLIDSNRVSPHYFYRDRLTEAYLRTFARVRRTEGKDQTGLPLTVIRDDEDLAVHEMGEENGSGPYHLIVTALNLVGSKELDRKTMLSEHFVFSREYTGSRPTGWVRTRTYRGGETKLARAMAISGAAAAPAAGQLTSTWWSMLLTVLNVRLGYWMENPWHYGSGIRPCESRWHLWPIYLGRELLGRMHARGRLVNLSDGGHTGDNLGLLPLIERRCRVIVVSDGEEDGDYAFGSFNNAVRMANIEENVRIDIDLSPLVPDKETGRSATSVALGTVHYPKPNAHEGILVYLKSSIAAGQLPPHVLHYAKTHPDFPHQTTGDQFFDDAQFESYRALGEHVGAEAATRLYGLNPGPQPPPEEPAT